jgi:hypothetical protein
MTNCRIISDEFSEITFSLLHPGLLQDHFRYPYGVRIFIFFPGKIPLVFSIPFKKEAGEIHGTKIGINTFFIIFLAETS